MCIVGTSLAVSIRMFSLNQRNVLSYLVLRNKNNKLLLWIKRIWLSFKTREMPMPATYLLTELPIVSIARTKPIEIE